MNSAIEYARRLLRDPPDFDRGAFDLVDDMLEADAQQKLDVRLWKNELAPFVYLSAYRPFSLVGAHPENYGIARLFTLPVKGRYAWLFTSSLLPIDLVERWELTPHFLNDTRGGYILQVFDAMKMPVELSLLDVNYTTHAALLFKNPRGIWQMSYFVEGLGPTGHTEAHEGQGIFNMSPARLCEEAYSLGYKTISPGVVDSIAETFETPAMFEPPD